MELLETSKLPRRKLPARLFHELSSPGPILLVGPGHSGKTHTLFELAKLLEAARHDYYYVRASDERAGEMVANAPNERVFLVDGIEAADPELLSLLVDRIEDGARGIGAMSLDGEDSRNYDHVSELFSPAHAEPGNRPPTPLRTVHLGPMARSEAARIAHGPRPLPLDSVTVDGALDLCWGRPGWLIDLLQLASSGKLLVDPYPAVASLDRSDLHLPVLRRASRIAEQHLQPEDVAAAVVLAALDARSLEGAASLVGMQAVTALSEARLLIPCPDDPRMVGVPEIYAAALRLQADPTLVRKARHRAAEQLLTQQALGIPLPYREAAFCAWHAGGSALDHDEPQVPASREFDEAHTEVLRNVAEDLVAFGRSEARDLLMLARDPRVLGELSRARAAVVFRGPLEGLRTMQSNDGLGLLYLHHQLLAEADHVRVGSSRDGIDDTRLAEAALVFERWNDLADLTPDAEELARIATSADSPEVALFAEQLLVLEHARRGHKLPRTALDPSGTGITRAARLASLSLGDACDLGDLLAAIGIAEGLIALLSGENLSDSPVFQKIAARLPAPAFQVLWAKHLCSTLAALAAGSVRRAAQEWVSFEQRLPRFLPVRLRSIIAAIGAELQRPGTTTLDKSDPSRQLLSYFRGSLDAVEANTVIAGDALTAHFAASPLPVFRLIAAHLEAVEAQNPAALMRVAERLQALDLWAPAAYALLGAKSIFLRRRASGSVRRCDEQLHAVEGAARKHVPWFSIGSLPDAPRTRLTKRELASARLASAGMTNRLIAERMQCSVRTVESHIANARAKLARCGVSHGARRAHARTRLPLRPPSRTQARPVTGWENGRHGRHRIILRRLRRLCRLCRAERRRSRRARRHGHRPRRRLRRPP